MGIFVGFRNLSVQRWRDRYVQSLYIPAAPLGSLHVLVKISFRPCQLLGCNRTNSPLPVPPTAVFRLTYCPVFSARNLVEFIHRAPRSRWRASADPHLFVKFSKVHQCAWNGCLTCRRWSMHSGSVPSPDAAELLDLLRPRLPALLVQFQPGWNFFARDSPGQHHSQRRRVLDGLECALSKDCCTRRSSQLSV